MSRILIWCLDPAEYVPYVTDFTAWDFYATQGFIEKQSYANACLINNNGQTGKPAS